MDFKDWEWQEFNLGKLAFIINAGYWYSDKNENMENWQDSLAGNKLPYFYWNLNISAALVFNAVDRA